MRGYPKNLTRPEGTLQKIKRVNAVVATASASASADPHATDFHALPRNSSTVMGIFQLLVML